MMRIALKHKGGVSKVLDQQAITRVDAAEVTEDQVKKCGTTETAGSFALLFGSHDPEAVWMACHLPSHLLLFSHLSCI